MGGIQLRTTLKKKIDDRFYRIYRCVHKKVIPIIRSRSKIKMRMLVVDYCVSSGFKVSSKIPLLSVADNNEVKYGEKRPWSWWVKWDTLEYYDDKGEIKTIQPDYSASEADFKYPMGNSEYFEDDEESDDDSDDVEEDSDKWCNDDNCIQLNYGYCLMKGRHPKTSDDDWKLFLESIKEQIYTEDTYNKIKNRIIERDGEVYGENWNYENPESN
jgi:hypothetical protein